jgi:hypothetical protein
MIQLTLLLQQQVILLLEQIKSLLHRPQGATLNGS